ncbi:MAG: orotate phosphoribosyltransferase, partial [Isosphaeraceae bacterium]
MSENEQRLLELLKTRSFQRGQFRLASGETSDYFIDGKMTEVYSEGAYLIGEVLYEWTKDLEIDAIG